MNIFITPNPLEVVSASPRCVACGAPLPRFDPYKKIWGRTRKSEKYKKKVLGTANDAPPEYGTRGDNLVCNTRCGHDLLLKLIKAVPGVIDLLPPEHRPDQKPLEVIPKIIAKKKAAKTAAKWRQKYKNK
jgi:hypothetical protein